MRRLCAGWSMAILLFAASARGHGGTPVAEAILVNPSDPMHVVVTTQYGGLFQTHDGGSTWEWVCEQAVGYFGVDAPPATLTASGTMQVVIPFEGISSGASTCAFSLWPSDESGPYFGDVRLVPQAPSEMLALRSNYTGSDFLTQVWRGDPQSSSWAVAGQPLAADFIGVSLAAAPGDPNRLYVAGGILDPDSQETLPVFETSRDGGTSFDRYAPSVAGVLRLIAVSPDASATAYVRLEAPKGSPDQILVFTDAGTAHHAVFSATGRLAAGALSPDGSELVVGGPDDGIWRASTSDLQAGATDAFTKVSSVSTEALTWTDQGLYSGGNAVRDGFSVGVSHDRGETFSPFLVLCKVAGPVSCAGACPLDGQYGWSAMQSFFPFIGCESESEPPPVEEEEQQTAPRGGCGCESAASGRMAGSWLAVGLASVLLARRRSLPERRARRLPGRHEARARR